MATENVPAQRHVTQHSGWTCLDQKGNFTQRLALTLRGQLFFIFECNSSEFNADPAGRLETKRMNKLQGKIRNIVILGIQSLVEWSQRSLFLTEKWS